jgi:hypothetical protein
VALDSKEAPNLATKSPQSALEPVASVSARRFKKIGSEAALRTACWMRFAGTLLQVLVEAKNILSSCRNRGKAGSSSRIR